MSQIPTSKRHTKLILIVEDEKTHADTLAYILGLEGYETRIAFDGQTAVELALQEPVPDMAILDIMLPDIMGTEVCCEIRKHAKTREMLMIMLTARSADDDRVLGFETGCDDYVTKPYSSRELILRIKALFRRDHAHADPRKTSEIVFGCLRVDAMEFRVWVKNKPVALTALEFRLLKHFLESPGCVQSREVLLSEVWGSDAHVTPRTVDTHMQRLREKLGSAGAYIETVFGVGYRLLATPDETTT